MRFSTVAMSVFGIATIVAAAKCAPAQQQPKEVRAEKTVTTNPPIIESASPDSVVMPYGGVVEVTLSGSGFVPGKPGKNTVHFNGMAMPQVPATSDGRQIVFAIPETLTRAGGAPPSTLAAGSYTVSVETTSGRSNAVTIRVYR
jgi:hypothetical protein